MTSEIINSSNLADIGLGKSARIESFSDDDIALKLLEMGCLPGVIVSIDQVAPLGCPVCISFNNTNQLALRKSEAATIIVTPL